MNTFSPPDVLRYLDSFEEHFWHMEKVTARSHALIVRITGGASEEQWRDAFNRVQQIHLSLNVSIGKRRGERPFFYRVPDRKLPLEFLDLTDNISLESFAEAALLRSFGAGDGPLTRVVIFRGEEQSAVVICSHHAVMDGKAHLYILRDALTVLAGGELRDIAQSPPASTSKLLGRRTPPYEGEPALNEEDSPQEAVHAIPPIRILRSRVQKADLDVLLKACRARSVSLHSALLVALAKMMIRSDERWQVGGVRALTPIDLRSRLGVEGAVGMFLVLHRIVIEEYADFWAEVTRLSDSLKPDGIEEASRAFFTLAEYLVADEHSVKSHIGKIGGSEFVHDLMVTNYGVLDWQGIGPFRIKDMFTAGVAGHFETQKVSVVTLNGNLHLTLVGQSPIPDLLESAIKELLMVSKG